MKFNEKDMQLIDLGMYSYFLFLEEKQKEVERRIANKHTTARGHKEYPQELAEVSAKIVAVQKLRHEIFGRNKHENL